MKKKLLALLLLVPILLIPIISCEGDALGGLSELMESFGKNSLIKGKIVVPDTSQGAKATEAMSDLAKLDKTDEGYADAYTAAVEEIRKATEEALASKNSAKAKAFVDKMQTALEEDAPKPEKVEEKVQELAKDPEHGGLGIDIVIETEGDLLAVILLVDLFEKEEDLENWDLDEDEDKIYEFINEAIQVIDIVKTVSPVNGIKIDDILGDLLIQFMGGGSEGDGEDKSVSRDGGVGEALAMVKPILDSVIKAIGVEENGKINDDNLKRMVSSFAIMRSSYEKLANALEKGSTDKKLSLSDIVNYLLSVVFTEADGIIKDATSSDGDGKTFKDLIEAYIEWDETGNDNVFADFSGLFGDGDADLFKGSLEKAYDVLKVLADDHIDDSDWIMDFLEDLKNQGGQP